MKNNLAALVLIGAITLSDATKLSSYGTQESSETKRSRGKDWDDMLDNTGVFGASSYASDAPEGYSNAVAEVVKEKEDKELAKIKEKEDAENAVKKTKEDAENLIKNQKQDAENAKKQAIVEAENKKKAEAQAKLDAEAAEL